MTGSGHSDARAAEIERGVLAVLRAQQSASIHYLWNHVKPPATHVELAAAAGRLVDARLAVQSKAGTKVMDECWDITTKGQVG